jgi:hypothetical protein
MSIKDNWEKEMDENMASIRKSYKSIQRNYYIIMAIMIIWLGLEIGTFL